MSSASETGQSRSLPSSPFDFHPRTRVVYGAGSFGQLGAIACEFTRSSVLLVTDAGLRKAGHCESARKSLEEAGLSVHIFDDVAPNPTTDDVDRCVAFASTRKIQLLVGLGGGSSMDCAKGTNFLLTNGGRMQDYQGIGKAKNQMLPMIAVPTTAGTGSEAQSFAVIADATTHMKMPCGDEKAACRVAILDPELTVTMPASVAAATGIDAMTHAIESYVTSKRNAMSQMFARQAWQLLSGSFADVMDDPANVEARGRMQLGAHLAGAAIENSMLGAAHATANPLSAHFDMVHGIAVGIMLPHVIRWNAPEVGELYRELAMSAGWAGRADSAQDGAAALADGFKDLLCRANMPASISSALTGDVSAEIVPTLAEEASRQWTGTFNPRSMDEESFATIYRNAW